MTVLVETPYTLRSGRKLVRGTVTELTGDEYAQAIRAGAVRDYHRPADAAPHADRMIHHEALDRSRKDA